MAEQLQTAYKAKAQELDAIASYMQSVKNEMQGLHVQRQTHVSQLQENSMAKEELELLSEDASVWKLIGPALVKQDKSEALDTVNKRLDFIRSTLERTEKELADKNAAAESKQKDAQSIQAELQQMQQRFQQMQVSQQQQQQQVAAATGGGNQAGGNAKASAAAAAQKAAAAAQAKK